MIRHPPRPPLFPSPPLSRSKAARHASPTQVEHAPPVEVATAGHRNVHARQEMEPRHEPPFPHDCLQGLIGCQFHFLNLLRSDIPENTRPPRPAARSALSLLAGTPSRFACYC